VSCVITVDNNGKRMLHTANAGDSRAILCRGGKGIRLTVDHKPTLPEETKRIKAAGGVVTPNKRVNGTLAVSRALGDHFLKAGSQVPTVDDRFIIQDVDIVTAVPHTDHIELTSEDTHLILACDGVCARILFFLLYAHIYSVLHCNYNSYGML
jgi:serine/threonine protein phosphatase PrpC